MYSEIFSHPNAIPFTDEQLDRMRSLYEKDLMSSVHIGAIFGIDSKSVLKRLKRMGVIVRKCRRQKRFTDDVCVAIAQQKSAGSRIIDLAEQYGCSERNICYALEWGRKVILMKQARQ